MLIGASGSGKSTFARKHFKPTEVLSSDYCRGLVADDENDQAATDDAFDVLHYIAAQAAGARGRLTVVDATNVQPEARKPLVALAREYHVLPVAIVLDLPERRLPRAQPRPARPRSSARTSSASQPQQLRRSLRGLRARGVPPRPRAVVARGGRRGRRSSAQPLWNDRTRRARPVRHHRRRARLLRRAARAAARSSATRSSRRRTAASASRHPAGRKAVFVGDLVDRGPDIARRAAAGDGHGRRRARRCACPATTTIKLLRKLRGQRRADHPRPGRVAGAARRASRRSSATQVADVPRRLVSHYVLDGGKLVVAHAGHEGGDAGPRRRAGARRSRCTARRPARPTSSACRCATTGRAEYRGTAMVVYGHTPVPEPEWLNHTINIDTGCVFGGKLTALRYPERELVSVPARARRTASRSGRSCRRAAGARR